MNGTDSAIACLDALSRSPEGFVSSFGPVPKRMLKTAWHPSQNILLQIRAIYVDSYETLVEDGFGNESCEWLLNFFVANQIRFDDFPNIGLGIYCDPPFSNSCVWSNLRKKCSGAIASMEVPVPQFASAAAILAHASWDEYEDLLLMQQFQK